jgi:hypothetical protein
MSGLGPRVARHVRLLWQLGGEFFDFDEHRPVIVDADTVRQEDDSTRASDRQEHPGVNGESENRGLRHRRAMVDESGFDCEFERADRSGRAGDQVRKIREGNCQPGGDTIDRQGEQKDRGSEDHTFACPDNDRLQEKKQRAGNAQAASGVEGKRDPVLDLCEFGICRQAGEEVLYRRLQAARCYEEDEQADSRDGERDYGNETQMRRGDAAYRGDEHQDEDEDVEEFFEDDRAEDDGGRGAEIARVREDAHDVADAQGEDVVGGERGHEDAGADEEVTAEGASRAGHHLAPAHTAQGVAGEGEAEDAEDPCGMYCAQSEDLVERDSAEGVPKEEGADEQAGNGLQQVAIACGCDAHARTRPNEEGWVVAAQQ